MRSGCSQCRPAFHRVLLAARGRRPVSQGSATSDTHRPLGFMKPLARLIGSLVGHAELVGSMAVQQVRRRYVETVGGIAWSVIQPLIMIATFWFVFSVGFRVQVGDGTSELQSPVHLVCRLLLEKKKKK